MAPATSLKELRSLIDAATVNISPEPIVKTNANGDVVEDGFCRFTDDYQGIVDESHQFHSLDQFQELTSEFGNPFNLLARLEEERGGPIAMSTEGWTEFIRPGIILNTKRLLG